MEPVIFVPGLNCDGDLFRDQLAILSDTHTARVADHTRDASMAAIARRILDETPEDRFALFGLSMGGYVALEIFAQAPERVSRLGLFNTSARADTDEAKDNRRKLIALAQAGRFDEVCETLWPKLVAENRVDDVELRARVDAMAERVGPEAFIRQQEAIMGRRDQRDRLSEIAVPTLVLVGADDRLTPPHLAQEMAEAIGPATLGVVPDCGHLSTIERPESVNRALRAFLAA
ncbi:MAG: alpha/beta fold hydrolase [Salinarimonadaceae bacterium]|nr:MAG: alpha/beta fold hydrolase [Salinarimonadaceae bacterium]